MENMKILCDNREDLPNVDGFEIDGSKPPAIRTALFMSKMKDTSRFRVGETVVEMGWTDTDRTLQKALHEVLEAKIYY
jgi:hypothetical protein